MPSKKDNYTAYYIDPSNGNDSSAGTSPSQAWRGFAPLQRQELNAGDRVEILTPGVFDQTLVLTASGTPEKPVRVNFAPGRYDFYPTRACRRVYNISNCNDDADGKKAIAVLVENSRHIRITGLGARIVYRGKMIELCIDNSEAVTVENLQFDYQRPTVSEYTVNSVTAKTADLYVHQDSTYRIDSERICWIGEGWTYETGLAQELIPETGEVWRRRDPLEGMRLEELAPFHLRAYGSHDLTAGRIIQLRDTFRDCVGVFLHQSKDITFRNLDFYFLHGMGVLGQFSENITLEQVRIAPEQGSGRTTAAWADCVHFSGCRGRLVLKDCLFCGAHDDAVNVHGTHLRIVEQIAARQLRVRFMHRQTYGFPAFHSGDEIAFAHWDSLAVFAENRVVDAKLNGTHEMVLKLQEPVPAGWYAGDVVENVTWTPEVEISGCTAKRIPSRGFLLTTRRRTRVINNEFVRLRIGIHIENDAEGWFESGPIRDMEICRNHFVACSRAGVCISPHNSSFNNSVHRNIRITDNEFILPNNGCAVEAGGTTGLSITGNRMQIPMLHDPTEMIRITDCAEVKLGDNLFEADSEKNQHDKKDA